MQWHRELNRPISRRSALTIGATGLSGLTLANVLQAEERASRSSGKAPRRKSVIIVHLDGGPPHLDTIDMKPHAPAEIRGEFAPVSTSIPGFSVCELMPQLAQSAERFAFIRSLVGSAGRHDAFQCQSGFSAKNLESLGGRPALGSVLTEMWAEPTDPAPAFVDMMQGRALVRNSARPGFLGPACQPFRPDLSALFERPLEEGMKSELARLGTDHTVSLSLNPDLSVERIENRRALLAGLDRIRRDVDESGMMNAMDRFGRQALGILTSGKLAAALDLAQEEPAVVERFTAPGSTDSRAVQSRTSEDGRAARKLLLARRLIEAGVRCVSVSFSDFDTHSSNFPRMRHLLPIVDHALCTLVKDLEERGLSDDVTVLAWGEFGRTPRIDPKTGGRHHWPAAGMALLAGGGMRTGQIIGATDATASQVISRPVSYQDVLATVYKNLGINARETTLLDPRGRPQYLLEDGHPLPELG